MSKVARKYTHVSELDDSCEESKPRATALHGKSDASCHLGGKVVVCIFGDYKVSSVVNRETWNSKK